MFVVRSSYILVEPLVMSRLFVNAIVIIFRQCCTVIVIVFLCINAFVYSNLDFVSRKIIFIDSFSNPF